MKYSLLSHLRCPLTRQTLKIEITGPPTDEVDEGWLVSEDGLMRWPIRGGIPRFVPESGYTDNFGMQWNHFRKTQLDSHSGHSISANRFWESTGWKPEELRDRWVLDAGCGAGRFAEVALGAGAHVVALDYSSAVSACQQNLRLHPNLHVLQGDIYALPFELGSFTFVYSLGVLQHTPDVAKAFHSLPPMVAPGGRLCVDYYEKTFKSLMMPKYWLRPITKRLPKPLLFRTLRTLVPSLLATSQGLGHIPIAGKLLKRLVPVANYHSILPLSSVQLHEWALLDTFDWFSPQYDQPQTSASARGWMELAGMQNIEVVKIGHLVARGTKRKQNPAADVRGK